MRIRARFFIFLLIILAMIYQRLDISPPQEPELPPPTPVYVVEQPEPEPEEIEIGDTLIMKATAYTAGPESTGKRPGDRGYGITRSGLPVARGTVAVDPRVIPLGTVLYVEGYGYAIALDTGKAIKGHRIDVFFHNVEEAIEWGVRDVKVKILKKTF